VFGGGGGVDVQRRVCFLGRGPFVFLRGFVPEIVWPARLVAVFLLLLYSMIFRAYFFTLFVSAACAGCAYC